MTYEGFKFGMTDEIAQMFILVANLNYNLCKLWYYTLYLRHIVKFSFLDTLKNSSLATGVSNAISRGLYCIRLSTLY